MPLSAPGRLSRVSVMLESLALFSSGLLAGTFVRGGLGLRPATAELPPAAYVQMRQSLIRNLRRLMLPLMLVALGSAGLAALGSPRRQGRLLRWIGFGCSGLPLVITRFGNVPLNRQMLAWSAEAPPGDWAGVVGRWETFDTVRALAAVAAFAIQVAATMACTRSLSSGSQPSTRSRKST